MLCRKERVIMTIRKKLAALLLSVSLLAAAGCAGAPAESSSAAPSSQPQSSSEAPIEKPVLHIGALKGPTGLGLLQVMEKESEGSGDNEYQFTIASNANEIVTKLVTGELDAAAMPTNLAATLYNKTKGEIQISAINTLGVLYLVTDEDIKTVSDLKGKTVYSSGQGAVPEYALDYILSANGIKEDVKVEYMTEHSELAAQLIAGKISSAVLPEPFVTQVIAKSLN